MLQSYTGTIRLFPNALHLGPARFKDLPAVGAFLVTGSHDGKTVTSFEVLSEKGRLLHFESPWPDKAVGITRLRDGQRIDAQREGEIWSAKTEPGERYSIRLAYV